MNLHHLLLVVACLSFGVALLGLPINVNLVTLGFFLWSLSWFF